ncbi:MAG TPA: acyltransferase [Sphingobacteriaceae bacterium]
MHQENIISSPSRSKPHFSVLDGLRGVAALAIVVFHFMEWVYTDFSQNFIGHGFLAVDFFFCLSGFVTGYAYDDRLGTSGIWNFFKARMIRLHPLVILGSVLGLLAFLFDPFGGDPSVYSTGRIALIFLCSLLLIPFPAMEDRAFNNFGLNAPSWSLFWEYIANIAYALILFRLARRHLMFLAVAAALLLVLVSYRHENLVGGWNGETFWDGGARILYSFTAGLLIHRSQWIIKNKLGFAGLSFLLILAFIFPWIPGWNWLTELLIVLVYFPLLIMLGAGAGLSARMKPVCVFSGQTSYPLYMTHYAFIWMFGNYLTNNKPDGSELTMVIISGTLLLAGLAYIVMITYDIPVRKYLARKQQSAALPPGTDDSRIPVIENQQHR